jgi:Dynein heavy chain AAA lid domain
VIIDELMVRNIAKINKFKEDDKGIAYEGIFLYAAMWGFGGGFADEDESREQYATFNNLWKPKTKIPDIVDVKNNKTKPIFDFYFDVETLSWVEW